jgi:hypothetical protein
MDVEQDLPDLSAEACPMSPHNISQLVRVKIEDVSDNEEEAFPVPIPWHAIKTECDVSCMSLSC